MAAAVVLHLTMVFYVMIPSFVLAVIPDYSGSVPLSIVSVVGVIHAILGAMALSLGFWLVGSWRFRRNLQGCINKKKIMLKTIIIWAAALILGIILGFGLWFAAGYLYLLTVSINPFGLPGGIYGILVVYILPVAILAWLLPRIKTMKFIVIGMLLFFAAALLVPNPCSMYSLFIAR